MVSNWRPAPVGTINIYLHLHDDVIIVNDTTQLGRTNRNLCVKIKAIRTIFTRITGRNQHLTCANIYFTLKDRHSQRLHPLKIRFILEHFIPHTVALTPLYYSTQRRNYTLLTDESETLPTFHHHHFWFNSKRRHLCEFWFIIYSKTNIYGFNRVSSFTWLTWFCVSYIFKFAAKRCELRKWINADRVK